MLSKNFSGEIASSGESEAVAVLPGALVLHQKNHGAVGNLTDVAIIR